MKIQSKYHGTIEYKEDDVILFNNGIPGFEHLNKFILFPFEDNEMFSILHSIQDETVGFIVVSPLDVSKDYEFEIEDKYVDELKIESSCDIAVVNTVTLGSKLEEITVNMRAPIIINVKEKIGEQLILNNEKYLIKYPLLKGDK